VHFANKPPHRNEKYFIEAVWGRENVRETGRLARGEFE